MFACTLLLAGCSGQAEQVVINGVTMGTTYEVKIAPGKAKIPNDLSSRVQQALDQLDSRFTTYSPGSELEQLNRGEVMQDISVSAEMLEVLQVADRVYQLTGGAFDPTVGPLVNLWGFGPDPSSSEIPPKETIRRQLARVGLDKLVVNTDGNSVRRTADIQLDLSAVAKGFAVDAVAELLESMGIANYLVEVGGELRLRGTKAEQQPWRIAIESPSLERHAVQQAMNPGDAAVATSGDYRNYFEKDGKRYSHTIDPRTGYPVSHHLASVTVVADTTAFADALATGLMVMGHEAALALAEKNDLAVYLLVKENDGCKAYSSPAFGRYLSGE
ncbi:MAG: FAD:protein FMN transferase [Porticoccaceae bacterium]